MKKLLKSTYSLNKKIDQLFNGDHVELDESGHILISPCNNCLNFINLQNGVILNQIKCTELNLGDREETIITFAYKNKHLIVAYNSGLLRHWLIKIEQDENQFKVDHILLRSWKSLHIHSVARIKFDSTELYIATGGSDGIVKLWNIKKYYCTHNFKEARGVISTITFASTFTQEIYYLFGSDDDYVIHIWNLINSKHIARLEGHSSKITEILITQDQRNFISASRDKLLILWNAITFEKERIMAVYESIESAVILSAKKLSIIDQTKCTSKNVILVAGESGLLKIWDYHTGNMLFTQNKSLLAIEKNKTNNNNNNENNIELQYTQINQLIYNLNLDSLVAISYDKDIIFHDISNLSPIRQLVGSNDEVLDLKFIGNDPQKNIAVATNSPKIKIFNIETLNCYLLVGHSDIVLALAVFDHDPFLMASSSKDNTVRVWHFSLDCLSAVCLFQGTGHTHSITSIFTSWKSTDSNFFITGSEDSTIKYWKLPNIDSFDINHSISNIKSKFTQSCHEKIINSVDVAPNNQLVATGSQDKTAKLWTLPNFKQLTVFRGHRKGIWFVKFSPVDEILATCSADTTIKLWSIANENCLKTFQGHMSSVLKLHFIDDGMQFMTSSSDGNVKIWNICSNECTTTFDAHEGKIWALALSNDEETLATGGDDSKIAIWQNRTEEIKEKEALQLESKVENEQALQNLLHNKSWFKGLKIAIKFGHPLRCLNILKEIILENGYNLETIIEQLVELRRDQLLTLFEYSIHWNTNSKHWLVAHLVIQSVLQQIPPEELLQLNDVKSKVEKLLPYCERHQARIERLRQYVTFADFVYEKMKLPDSECK